MTEQESSVLQGEFFQPCTAVAEFQASCNIAGSLVSFIGELCWDGKNTPPSYTHATLQQYRCRKMQEDFVGLWIYALVLVVRVSCRYEEHAEPKCFLDYYVGGAKTTQCKDSGRMGSFSLSTLQNNSYSSSSYVVTKAKFHLPLSLYPHNVSMFCI